SDLRLQNLELNIDKIDLENQVYEIDKLSIDGLGGNLAMFKQSTKADTAQTKLPTIRAKLLDIKNISFDYSDHVNRQSIKADIGDLGITKANMNLANTNISMDELALSRSNLQLNFTEQSKPDVDSVLPTNKEVVEENK